MAKCLIESSLLLIPVLTIAETLCTIMKNLLAISIISLILIFSISCKDDRKVDFKPENYLQQISEVELQTFELDTISLSEIKGTNGTQIWFIREAFDVAENQKITLELKEFYDFKELIFNNLNTITNKGELLESSGVIYLDFKADGKSLELKKNRRIGVSFPDNRLKNNNIYSGTVDTLNQFTWNEEEIFVGVKHYNQEYAIDVLKIIPRDSLEFYYQDIPETIPGQTENDFFNITGSVFLNRFKWINIDFVIFPDRLANFELIPRDDELENLNIYFLYSNLNSFVSDHRTVDNLVFKNIPVKNQTNLIIVGKSDGKFYMDKINLSEITDEQIEIDLKETDLNEIRELVGK